MDNKKEVKMVCSSVTGRCYPVDNNEFLVQKIHELEERLLKIETRKPTAEEYSKLRDAQAEEIPCPFKGTRLEKPCYCGHTDMCTCGNPGEMEIKANSYDNLMQNIKN